MKRFYRVGLGLLISVAQVVGQQEDTRSSRGTVLWNEFTIYDCERTP